MTEREALKLALEALEAHADIGIKFDKAITAIKEALAQEKALQALHDENERLGLYKDAYAQPEPWEKFCDSNCVWTDHHSDCKLAQRTWVGLTEEERVDIAYEYESSIAAALMVEAKLREKNT